ncbi:hypothetical protein DSO57_1018994 [Entomophthora muscae]|uniref:Uncharacterized protein n=1 Tax=Entomophthora muscae TaxID=34485 RepID=A0ACC2RIP0_9FUNG|nr:hypothetical protein DSO57_1018994 [Entomophthora muscae]
MDQGTIIEKGNHTKLMGLGGTYHRLVGIQNVQISCTTAKPPISKDLVLQPTSIGSHKASAGVEAAKKTQQSAICMAVRLYNINCKETYLYLIGILGAICLGMLYPSFAIGSIVVGLVHGWKLALAIIATLPLIIGAGYLQIGMSKIFQENNKKAYACSAEVACQATAAVRTVAALTKEDSVIQTYSDKMQGPLEASFCNAFLALLAYAGAQSIKFLINTMGFWHGATLFCQGKISFGDFFVVLISLVVGCSNIGCSLAFGPNILKATTATRALFTLLDRQPLVVSPPPLPAQLQSREISNSGRWSFPTPSAPLSPS